MAYPAFMNHQRLFLTLAIALAASFAAKADTTVGVPINTVPFLISKPGKYRVTKNLNNTGTGAAIVITAAARDVVLDLNGFTLTGQSSNSASNIGILVGAPNVIIRNGTIRKFNTAIMDGIAANGTMLEDIVCLAQTSVGVRFSALDVILRRVNVRNVGATSEQPGEIYGFLLTGSSVVENCTVLNIPVRVGATAAIRLEGKSHSIREIDIHRIQATALFINTELTSIIDRVRIRDCNTGVNIVEQSAPPLVRESTIRDCLADVAGAIDDGGRNNLQQ